MPFNIFSFLIGSAMLKRQGVVEQKANQLAILSGFMPMVQGLVVAKVLGDREVSTAVAQPTGGPGGETTVEAFPSLKSYNLMAAYECLVGKGYTNIRVEPISKTREVMGQYPEAEKRDVPKNNEIILYVRSLYEDSKTDTSLNAGNQPVNQNSSDEGSDEGQALQ